MWATSSAVIRLPPPTMTGRDRLLQDGLPGEAGAVGSLDMKNPPLDLHQGGLLARSAIRLIANWPHPLSGNHLARTGWLARAEAPISMRARHRLVPLREQGRYRDELLRPRKGSAYFDNTFVETGPPPILTRKGWLLLYHGIDEAVG